MIKTSYNMCTWERLIYYLAIKSRDFLNICSNASLTIFKKNDEGRPKLVADLNKT